MNLKKYNLGLLDFIVKDKVYLVLFSMGILLNLSVWGYWKIVVKEAGHFEPMIYSLGLLIFNFIISCFVYKKEPLSAYLLLTIAALAQILTLVLLRYYFLVAGLL